MVINKNKIITYSILLSLSIILTIGNNTILLLLFQLFIGFLVVKYSKFSFFSVMTIVLLFSYLQGVIRHIFGPYLFSNTLHYAGTIFPYYFSELSLSSLFFVMTALFFVWFTKIVVREKEYYTCDFNISISTATLLSVFAFLIVFIVFPSLPTLSYEVGARARNESVPYGLVLMSLFIFSLVFDKWKDSRFIKYITIISILWILFHGERAELLGFLTYLGLRYSNILSLKKNSGYIDRRKKYKLYILIFFVALLFCAVGLKRIDNNTNLDVITIIGNLLIQGTAADAVNDFYCATDIWKTGHLMYGATYLDYLIHLLPVGRTNEYNVANILLRDYKTMGGALFYSEGIMNFGIYGVLFFNIIFFAIINQFIKKRNKLKQLTWIPVVLEVFRICWYGIDGWVFASCVEIPIFYFFIYCLKLNKS